MKRPGETVLDDQLAAIRTRRQEAGLWRNDAMPRVELAVDLSSNDYLGLARDPRIVEAIADAARQFGAGGRAARLLSGGSPMHEACEQAAAEWLGADAGLLFPSGYQANLGLIGALAARGDAVISDRDNHASIIDGARLSGAQVLVYEHFDITSLERQLRRACGAKRRLVVTESVFSMRGDLAPLEAIHELCARYDAWLIVDEAHAIGLLGPEGAGACSALDEQEPSHLAARVITGGKAMGVGGALVLGSHAMRAHLVNHARSFMFTTAPPPALAAGLKAAIACCRQAHAERARVLGSAKALASQLALPEPAAAIVPIPVGDAARALSLSQHLREHGFGVPAVRPPTVAPGESLLRAVCHADFGQGDRQRLVSIIQDAWHAPAATMHTARRRPFVVVGTDTGVGKTIVSALISRALNAQGAEFAYWKPVQTGSDDDTQTVSDLAELKPELCLPNFANYPLPASPHEAAAASGTHLDPDELDEAFLAHCNASPTRRLVIELAGGLLVPYALDPLRTQADWLSATHAEVILVARSGVGTLNHTMLTLESMRSRRIKVRALFLVGEPHPSNHRTLSEVLDVPYIVELPQFNSLTTTELDRWLSAHPLEELIG